MKIAVIGAGAMGSIYGGKLSQHNTVYLIEKNEEVVSFVREHGLTLHEENSENVYYPNIMSASSEIGKVDLIIVFVKSIFSEQALKENSNLIGSSTYLLSLQNGAGHEEVLSKFVPEDRVIIGTTEDNGKKLKVGHVERGGKGVTNIGLLKQENTVVLDEIKASFDQCGFITVIYKNIQQLVWNKLLQNASLSSMTGVLKCNIGYVKENSHAWESMKILLEEAVMVARAMGLEADIKETLEKIIYTAENSPQGITSICFDLRNGLKTEVDFISGAVVKKAEENGIEVPNQKLVVNLIHAMEDMTDKD